MADEDGGKMAESSTAENQPGQNEKSDTPTGDENAAKKDETATSKDDGKEKAPPYDQDPKWKKARAAEARIEKILSKHGYESIDDFESDFENAKSVKELVGDRDAKTLIEDSTTLQQYREYWKKQEEEERLSGETAEEKADRLEKELNETKKEKADREKRETEEKALVKALEDYETSAIKIVSELGLSDKEESAMAKLLLGVKNPFNDIDLNDRVASKKTITEMASKFKTFLDGVRQKAINEYAKGKSKFVPISENASPSSETVVKKPIPKDASVNDIFKAARAEMHEMITKGMSS